MMAKSKNNTTADSTGAPQKVSRGTLLQRIGRKLAELRAERNVTMDEIASKSGVSVVTVSNLLGGKLKNTSFETVEAVADALGADTEILILSRKKS